MLLSLIRSIVLYLLLIAVIRLMGKRQLGEMEPSEFVVTLLIADLAAVPMQDGGIPLLVGVIPILTVLALELLLSVLSYHCIAVRRLLCGKPVVLVEDGSILQTNLRKTRITANELTEHLREKGIVDLTKVKYAILETNGQVSAILYARHQPPTAEELGVSVEEELLPVTLINGGQLLRDNLTVAGKSEQWVHSILKQRGVTVSQVYLLTVDGAGNIFYAEKEQA